MLARTLLKGPQAAAIVGLSLSVAVASCQRAGTAGAGEGGAHMVGPSDVETGRYLATVAGCNDCHTDGYLFTEGNVPEEAWFLGSALGWRGPWGTTYASNLRLRVQEWTEDQWVATLKGRKALPPMPWMNVNRMSESDARLMYRYLRSLGPAGEHAPSPVPPDGEPTGPFISLEPVGM